jgi:hypothetical protein
VKGDKIEIQIGGEGNKVAAKPGKKKGAAAKPGKKGKH